MLNQPHPFIDFVTLLVIFLAAFNYSVLGMFGTDLIRSLDPLPPTFAVLIGLAALWQALRQPLL